MSEYRRAYQPGGYYFFTLVTHKRKPILCTQFAIERLRASFRYTMLKHPFDIEAIVIMPDHLHCIWRMPEHDADFSKRWSMIKRHFSVGMKGDVNSRGEKDIWQRRFWEHLIRDENDLHRHLDYIYYNPVKHGYADTPYNWLFSSFRKDVEQGFYEKDWGANGEPNNFVAIDCE